MTTPLPTTPNLTLPGRVRMARTLRLRLSALREELSTCTTAAMRRCVEETILDTERQLTELGWY